MDTTNCVTVETFIVTFQQNFTALLDDDNDTHFMAILMANLDKPVPECLFWILLELRMMEMVVTA